MIVSINCNHCGTSFDAEAEEPSVFCPHCEREVLLGTARRSPTPGGSKSQLMPCADCSAIMSRRALWCQQCGSLQRSLFSLIWSIMCEFWLVTLIVGIIGWVVLKVIGMLIPA